MMREQQLIPSHLDLEIASVKSMYFCESPEKSTNSISLAIAEVKLALSRVIWNFDMELAPESFGWLGKQKMLTTWKKEAMKVKLTSRF